VRVYLKISPDSASFRFICPVCNAKGHLVNIIPKQVMIDKGHYWYSRTQNPEPRTQNPEPRTQNPESRIQNPESRIQNPESRIQNPESRIQNPERYNKQSVLYPSCLLKFKLSSTYHTDGRQSTMISEQSLAYALVILTACNWPFLKQHNATLARKFSHNLNNYYLNLVSTKILITTRRIGMDIIIKCRINFIYPFLTI